MGAYDWVEQQELPLQRLMQYKIIEIIVAQDCGKLGEQIHYPHGAVSLAELVEFLALLQEVRLVI